MAKKDHELNEETSNFNDNTGLCDPTSRTSEIIQLCDNPEDENCRSLEVQGSLPYVLCDKKKEQIESLQKTLLK